MITVVSETQLNQLVDQAYPAGAVRERMRKYLLAEFQAKPPEKRKVVRTVSERRNGFTKYMRKAFMLSDLAFVGDPRHLEDAAWTYRKDRAC